MKKIIAVNAGSSSLKFQLFELPSENVPCSGVIERIGLNDGIFTLKFADEKVKVTQDIPDHKVAVQLVLDALIEHKIVDSLESITGCGHRVVHGGELYQSSVEITAEVEKNIESLSDLAPLHNPANLVGFRAFAAALPHARHVAVFDTAFHQTMAKETYMYAIPYEYYEDYKIRRYGFHGTSHFYISHRFAEILNKDVKDLNVITCHLGNGASIAAVKGGKSINTSMGFTPLAGVMMGTRSGDIDPAIISFIMEKTGQSETEVVNVLNKKSGMLGVSGISSDARDIENAIDEGNERAKLTRDMYCKRVADFIGAYFVQLGHVDGILFTGGLGENAVNVREIILKHIEEAMNLSIDYDLNLKVRGKEIAISKDDSTVAVWIIPTNEELVIARDATNILKIK